MYRLITSLEYNTYHMHSTGFISIPFGFFISMLIATCENRADLAYVFNFKRIKFGKID